VDSVVSSQPLGYQRDFFGDEKIVHEGRISVADGRHIDSSEYVAATKCFGDKSSSISSEIHYRVDKQFHGMDTAPRACFAGRAARQQDMVHAAGTQNRVVDANGNAGAQHSVQDNWKLACPNLADMYGYAIFVRKADSLCSRPTYRCRLEQIVSDM
jgi:hypothetical protein